MPAAGQVEGQTEGQPLRALRHPKVEGRSYEIRLTYFCGDSYNL
jgi:hypothetical protein